jgi:hypothetical protein
MEPQAHRRGRQPAAALGAEHGPLRACRRAPPALQRPQRRCQHRVQRHGAAAGGALAGAVGHYELPQAPP